ncbi:MAG: HAD family phosphatase [Lachnospiraceae bacterium]|nr:HAD family phosphatase [Lachnospiraceae bacterium]
MEDIIKGVIFDLDGTLIDSMWIWSKVDDELLLKYGCSIDTDYKNTIMSMTFHQGLAYIIKRYGLNKSVAELAEELIEMAYFEYANNTRLKKGAVDFLAGLKARGVKLAMATSSARKMCEAVLNNNNIFRFFEAIVYSDEVGKNKTNPDIYLKAAELIRVSPSDCAVFEDVPFALSGIKAAGMKSIGVYDKYSAEYEEEMKKNYSEYIYEFNPKDIDRLLLK